MSEGDSGDDLQASAAARVGAVLNDKWTLEKLLGTGGMGAVYEGRHRNGARAAVKVLHPQLAREPGLRERFLREGYAANRVDHPDAVKVLDDDTVTSGPAEGTAYLVMELLRGESLQDRINREAPVSEREFLMIASAVLGVLEKAHANGVLHRDLKPENIWLLADEPRPEEETSGATSTAGAAGAAGATSSAVPTPPASAGGTTPRPRVKVLDFGLARLVDAQSTTHHGIAVGTPSFMSPEQASGDNSDLDGRTDLFSLAATGFRLVGGRRVHEGAPHPVMQVANMATLPAPKIKTVAPHVTLPFARVIDRALSFKREDRHPDAAAMRADVEKALAEIDEIARNPTMHEIPDVPLPPSAQVPAAPPASLSPAPAEESADVVTDALATTVEAEAVVAKAPPAESKAAEREAGAAEEKLTPAESNAATSAPGAGARRSLVPLAVVGLLSLVGLGAWFVTRESTPPPVKTSASAEDAASPEAEDAARSATTAPNKDAAVEAPEPSLDASADAFGTEAMLELEAGAPDRQAPASAASASRAPPKPKGSGTPKTPAPKASQKPGQKAPPKPASSRR